MHAIILQVPQALRLSWRPLGVGGRKATLPCMLLMTARGDGGSR